MNKSVIKRIYQNRQSASMGEIETKLQNPDELAEDALIAYTILYKEKTKGISNIDEEISTFADNLNQRLIIKICRNIKTIKDIVVFWFVANLIAFFIVLFQLCTK